MSADVINLRQFRKKASRSEKERKAEENRIHFGRTKAEKQLTRALNEQEGRKLEAGRIENPGDDEHGD